MNATTQAPQGFSPARAARLLLRTAALAFVFALPGSLNIAHCLLLSHC